jgi:hypothetical protein
VLSGKLVINGFGVHRVAPASSRNYRLWRALSRPSARIP